MVAMIRSSSADQASARRTSALRVPAVYLTSAFLPFLSVLSKRRMNNLRVCSGLNGSIPTAPTSFLFHFTGLEKFARQQKAALTAGQRWRASIISRHGWQADAITRRKWRDCSAGSLRPLVPEVKGHISQKVRIASFYADTRKGTDVLLCPFCAHGRLQLRPPYPEWVHKGANKMANVEEMFQWLQEQRWVLSEDGFLTCTAGDGDIRVFAHSKTVPPT